MTIYRVATPLVTDADSQGVIHVRFAPNEGAARAFRRELAEAHSFKLDQVIYKPIDVHPGKAGLVAYLNAFHAQAPAEYVPAGYPKAAAPAKKLKK